jgi:uncharacterized sulfatase
MERQYKTTSRRVHPMHNRPPGFVPKGFAAAGNAERKSVRKRPPNAPKLHWRIAMRLVARSHTAFLFLLIAYCACSAGWVSLAAAEANQPQRPNILWLTAEDIGPHLGCYGDKYADTPNLDRLAEKGTVYLHAWSNAPVCAPARTAIISGVYPPSTGSQHMRSLVDMPEQMRMYPEYLREAGYYCTNNSKEDYNLRKRGQVWDESSRKAHWKNRNPGQPFFAIFNYTTTHESRIRRRPHDWVHDPAKAPLPDYHPDTLEVRQDWAQYYDNITTMDTQAGKQLEELEKAGLADDTIVFFYGDHGSGMPRSKRWPYNSGLQVPMIVYVPPKWQHLASDDYAPGAKTPRLVAFVDLAPTALSLAGIEPPPIMQGRAFLGKHEAPPKPFLHGFRGRMDERYEMIRSVTDGRYVYIRNYTPHVIYGQHVAYMFVTPTTRIWHDLYHEGKLNEAQSHFWQRKPPEELYDLKNDPHEVNNLADSAEHQSILQKLRAAQQEHARAIRDLGFLPEPEIHRRSKGTAPYTMGHDRQQYPMQRIMATAEAASMLEPEAVPRLEKDFDDPDSAVRYWAALGMLMRGKAAVEASHEGLVALLDDPSPAVRVAAAWGLGQHGDEDDLKRAMPVLLEAADYQKTDVHTAQMAFNALDYLEAKAMPWLPAIKAIPSSIPRELRRVAYGLPSVAKKTIQDLEKAAEQ